MVDVPDTRPSLLLRIRNLADHKSWQEFDRMYRPLVESIARSFHLRDGEEDIWQLVALKLAREIGEFEYDSSRSFAAFVITVARRTVLDQMRRSKGKAQGVRGSSAQAALAALPSREEEDVLESAEELGQVLQAVEGLRGQFKDRTLDVFRLTIEGRSTAEVAEKLEMTVNAVRVAKSKVLRDLRRQLAADGGHQGTGGGES
jgi:RNA polymerase sigma-70 factor (ECF subfamily)